MADPGGQAGDQSSPSCFPSHTQRAFDAAATQSRLKTSATPRRAVGREPVIRVQTSRDAVRGMWLIGACWVSGALRPGPASGLSDSSVVSVSDSGCLPLRTQHKMYNLLSAEVPYLTDDDARSSSPQCRSTVSDCKVIFYIMPPPPINTIIRLHMPTWYCKQCPVLSGKNGGVG